LRVCVVWDGACVRWCVCAWVCSLGWGVCACVCVSVRACTLVHMRVYTRMHARVRVEGYRASSRIRILEEAGIKCGSGGSIRGVGRAEVLTADYYCERC